MGRGDRLGIVGETGSGKSTLLKLIGGLEQPDEGQIVFESKNVAGPMDQLIPGHKEMVYLSQHFDLPKFISVIEYLDDPYLIATEEAEQIYAACRISHLLDHITTDLSGGEKQRVALAKLLLKKPKVLLLDEPFSNLDLTHRMIIGEVIDTIEKSLGTSAIMVTHDPKDVLPWAHRVAVMRKGIVAQIGSPREVYKRPVDRYVAELFGPINLIQPAHWGLGNHDFTVIDGKALIRPENFMLSASGMHGQVIDKRYLGGCDHVTVSTSVDRVLIRTRVDELRRNDEVYIQIVE